MADYIYTMEIRLTPDQQRGVTLVQDIARAAGMNIYLTGGAVRDIISGFPIRDLDFSVQGNPLKLQKELERAGANCRYRRRSEDPLPGPAWQCARRDQHGPHRALRKGREAADNFSRDPDRRSAPPGLHHQRHGAVAESGFARVADGSLQRRC